MQQKIIFLIILLTIVIAGAILGGWFWLKQGNEFSDWKTYKNEEYGFEFRYPITGTLNKSSNENITNIRIKVRNGKP